MSHQSSHHHPLRRGIGLLAVSALTATALAGLSTAPAQAVEPDSAPVAGGAQWLSDQLSDGLVFNPNFGGFNDYGLSVDTGLALAEVGDTATVDTISAALAENVNSYTTGVDFESDDQYAGATAKAAAFAQVAGDDPRSYGGVDLVQRLTAMVRTEGPSAGRIQDVTTFADSVNTIGQAFAVRALDGADSTLTDPATDFLLAQQCEEGFFRLSLSAPAAADQTCDGESGATPDTDVTALAMLQLQSQADDTDVRAALDAGAAWLVETQAADGSWGGAGPTSGTNSNSTGLATWALRLSGEDAAAGEGAAWVQGLQVTALGECSGSPLGSQTGAVAYNAAALATGEDEGITEATADQWRRTTSQVLPALLSLTSAPSTDDLTVTGPSRFRRAGSSVVLQVSGLREGEQACLAGVSLTGGGTTSATVRLPATTGNRSFRVVRLGSSASTTVRALAAATFKVGLVKARVAQRGTQAVRANGLASGESVEVRYQGRVVAEGTAGPAGKFAGTFKVGFRTGAMKVKVVGEFGNRSGVRSFRVVSSR